MTLSPGTGGPRERSHVTVRRRSTEGVEGSSHCSPASVMSAMYDVVDGQLAACKDVVLAHPGKLEVRCSSLI